MTEVSSTFIPAGDLVESFVQDKSLFDAAHKLAEFQIAPIATIHVAIDTTLARINLEPSTQLAIQIGIKAFEVIEFTEKWQDRKSILETLPYLAQFEPGGNFIIAFITEMERMREEFPRINPGLADVATRLCSSHLDNPGERIASYAVVGAGLAYSVFDETSLWRRFDGLLG